MSENLKTIKELADELGVSKNKIHYQVSKIPSEYVVRNNGMKFLTEVAVKKIKENLSIQLNSHSNSKLNSIKYQENPIITEKNSIKSVELNGTLNSYLNSLKLQIKHLESQNINKDEQIKSLVEAQKQTQNLLDQQQRLALQDKQLLQEYKAENDKLKSLKTPSNNLDNEREFAETMRQTYEEDLVKLNQELNERKKLQEEMEEERNQLMEIQRKLLANQKLPKKWYEFWK